jgi:hypothetical protein
VNGFRVVHSVSDIENLRIDDTSMLYHRSCYKTYTSRRNCGFFKVELAGSDQTRRAKLREQSLFIRWRAGKF